jgi:NAD(P)H dehydrogenase (quinone)
MATVLLLFDSRGGLTEQLAAAVAEGVNSVPGAELRYRRLEDATTDELKRCDALILGSPNWSGMTGKLKDWLDYSGDLWETGELAGKVGAAFTAGYSRSGGIEATLLQLLHLLFAHGMVAVGLPWSDRMRTSGSYYGATAHGEVTEDDREQARILGRRVAETAARLVAPR